MKEYEISCLLNNSVPFYGKFEEFVQLNKVLIQAKQRINKSDNPREVIIETWFLFDFLIRKLLLKAFGIERFENDTFNPMYDYLPQSFDSCLKSFESLLKQQRKIFNEKLHPNTVRKYPISNIPASFLIFLNEKDPNLLVQFLENCDEYEKSYEFEYYELKEKLLTEDAECECVSKIWIDCCKNIDDDWFKEVKRLNTTRNKAAHLFNSENIYSSFGINGDNKFELLKKKITKLLDEAFFFSAN